MIDAAHDRSPGRGTHRWALATGVTALVAAMLLWAVDAVSFFQGYLTAYMLWFSVPIGSLAILMTHHLTGGRWGWSIRRLLGASSLTMPLFALLFVPVFFGIHALYDWADPDSETISNALVPFREIYLSPVWFSVRSVCYLVAWVVLSVLVVRLTAQRDRLVEDATLDRRLQRLSAGGLIVLITLVSLASIDWVASLEEHWFSSIYGLYVFIGQALLAMGLMMLLALLATRRSRRGWDQALHEEALPRDIRHDLGNLLLMLVVLYAYMGFAQFLIIWNGNLPVEITWYLHRQEGAWKVIVVLLMLFQFAAPFLALLFRTIKRSVAGLLSITLIVLASRVLDAAWFVMPSFNTMRPAAFLVAVLAAVGMGGLWLGLMLWQWRRWPADAPLHHATQEQHA